MSEQNEGGSRRILVLGATGTVGGSVLKLLASGQNCQVTAASRRPESASLAGVSWVKFDYEDPSTYRPAAEGISTLFMVVRPGDDTPQETAIPFLQQAKEAGVTKVVLLSAMGAEKRPEFGLRILERHIEASGFRFVHLRPNWFMQLFTSGSMFHDLMTTSALHLPAGDAAISYIDAHDIARVAAAVLVDDTWDGNGFTLTGPQPLTHAELIDTLSRATGRTFSYVPLTEVQARAGLAAAGFSEARIERLVNFYRLVRQGVCAPVTSSVEDITSVPATTWHQFVTHHTAIWG